MKGIIGTPMYMTTLFPKKLSNKIKDIPLTKEAKKRLKWIQHYQDTKNISKTCRYFGISRTTFYKWFERYKKDGLEGLLDRPKTPKNTRKPTIRNQYREQIIKVRKQNPTWSKEKISAYLQEEKNIKVSPSTVYKVLKEEGLIERTKSIKIQNKRRKSIKKKRTKRGLQAQAPGDVVQIDVKHLNIAGATYYQFTAIDKYSRFCFARVYESKNSKKTKEFYIELNEYFEFEIKRVQTDNGSEFLGEFNKYLTDIGVEHYFSYPRSPKTNGVVERLIRTIEEELWLIEGLDYTLEEMNKKLRKYVRKYNFIRPHHSLGYKRPADIVYGV